MNLDDYLTIVIPVKNEERNLPDCLASIRSFRHVVLVDSGSEDRTQEIFHEYAHDDWIGVDFRWDGRFPKKRNWILRNFSFKTPWAMFLDADERITPGFVDELEKFLSSHESRHYDVIRCQFDNWFCGRMLNHGDTVQKTAIVRVGSAEYEKIDEDRWSKLDMEIHEHIQTKRADAEYVIKARLEHHDYRSLESHWQKHLEYAKWEAGRYWQLKAHPDRWIALTKRQRIKYSLITSRLMAVGYAVYSYVVKCGFLDGIAGFRFAKFKFHYFRFVRRRILEAKPE